MKKEFVMRGRTASTAGLNTEILNFSGHKPGYAFKITEFSLYPSTDIGSSNAEMCGTITAGKTSITPTAPNFNDEGLIATSMLSLFDGNPRYVNNYSVINETFLITQNLILTVQETSGNDFAVNWQCRFEAVKMSGPEEAVANYKQFMISDD